RRRGQVGNAVVPVRELARHHVPIALEHGLGVGRHEVGGRRGGTVGAVLGLERRRRGPLVRRLGVDRDPQVPEPRVGQRGGGGAIERLHIGHGSSKHRGGQNTTSDECAHHNKHAPSVSWLYVKTHQERLLNTVPWPHACTTLM